MSCTILTVPFDLVENEKGEFLKKGFVIDQQLQKNLGIRSIIGATYIRQNSRKTLYGKR
jgi:hypothetical protein